MPFDLQISHLRQTVHTAAQAVVDRGRLQSRDKINKRKIPATEKLETLDGITPEEDRFTTFDKLQLRYAWFNRSDSASHVCVIVPGNRASIKRYQGLANDYARQGYQVVACDHRSQGGSDGEMEDPSAFHATARELKRDLEDFLYKVVLPELNGRPLVLVGHSMGAALIALLVTRKAKRKTLGRIGLKRKKPIRPDCLVFVAPLIETFESPRLPLPRPIASVNSVRVSPRVVPAVARAGKMLRRGKHLFARPGESSITLTGVGALYVLIRQLRRIPLIDIPTIIVLAEKDGLISNKAAKAFDRNKIAPDCQRGLYILEGATHDLNREGGEKVSTGYSDFIHRITSLDLGLGPATRTSNRSTFKPIAFVPPAPY